MGKTYSSIVKAFNKNKDKKQRHDRVSTYKNEFGDFTVVTYYYTDLLKKNNRTEVIEVPSKVWNWNTVSTRSRLSDLGVQVTSNKFVMHIFGYTEEKTNSPFVSVRGEVINTETFEEAEALALTMAQNRKVFNVGRAFFVR